MNLTTFWTFIGIIIAGFAVFVFAIVFVKYRRVRRLGTVSPVGEKMLRQPGHSLRIRIEQLSENLSIYLAGGFLLPMMPAALILVVVGKLGIQDWPTFFAMLSGLFVALIGGWVIGFRIVTNKLNELANCALGLRGEELVAQQLNPLYRNNYRIFHDFPIQGRTEKANIDHIVIGPTGVFVIETKMRRKHKKLKTGKESHRVEFTGQELIYPAHRDRHGIDQTEANAKHLAEFIQRETGHRLPVTGILALPGWYIETTKRGKILVRNHKSLVKAILSQDATLDQNAFRDAVIAVRKQCNDVKV